MRSHLFVLSGPNGAGKTTFLRVAARYAAEFDVVVFQKLTTRPTIPGAVADPFESLLVSKEEFARHRENPRFGAYRIMDDEWGFDVESLRSLCAQHRNVLLTSPNPAFTRRLGRTLREVRLVRVYIYADEARRVHRISNDTATAETQEFRHFCAPRLLARYRRAPLEYDHVILNIFDQATFERHVRALLRRYSTPVPGSTATPDTPMPATASELWQPQPGGLVANA